MTPLPYETTVKDVIVRIESKLAQNPNLRDKISAVLKNRPKAYRVATLYEIINPATSEHHHWCLKITSIDRSKAAATPTSCWPNRPLGSGPRGRRFESSRPDQSAKLAFD
jgi:hypothetical protein